MNLNYLVDENPKKSFPWSLMVLALLLLGLFVVSIYLYFNKEKKIHVLHRIEQGDKLRTLAYMYYNHPGKWRRIFYANREKLEKNEQKKLSVGDVIRIPLTPEEKSSLLQRIANSEVKLKILFKDNHKENR